MMTEPPHASDIGETELAFNARKLYERTKDPLMLTRSTDREITGSRDIIYKPDWSKSKIGRNDKYQILETDIQQIGLQVPVTKESLEKILTTDDFRYAQSSTTFIHRRDRKTGEEQQFLMTLVPDVECMESTGFKPFKNVLYGLSMGEFSGWVIYYDVQGNFVSGWKCKAGKSVATLKWIPRDESELVAKANAKTKSLCSFEYSYIIPRYCLGSSDDEGVTVTCWKEKQIVIVTYYACPDEGGGGDIGGGGGGGGSGGDTGNPSNPQDKGTVAPKSDKLFKGDFTEEEWKALEKIIEDILKDCAGGNLYNLMISEINGHLELSFGSGNSATPMNGSIELNKDRLNAGTMFHELFHIMQASRTGTDVGFSDKLLNVEIEARLAQYRYFIKHGVPQNEGGYTANFYDQFQSGRAIAKIAEGLDSKGGLLPNVSEFNLETLFRASGSAMQYEFPYEYGTYTFDYELNWDENISLLKEISKDC